MSDEHDSKQHAHDAAGRTPADGGAPQPPAPRDADWGYDVPRSEAPWPTDPAAAAPTSADGPTSAGGPAPATQPTPTGGSTAPTPWTAQPPAEGQTERIPAAYGSQADGATERRPAAYGPPADGATERIPATYGSSADGATAGMPSAYGTSADGATAPMPAASGTPSGGSATPMPAASAPSATAPAPAPGRRGPGWGGVGALVVLGMMLSSGATLGGVVVYDQFLDTDPAATSQPAPSTSAEAAPAAAATGETPDWAQVAEQVSPSTVAIRVETGNGTGQGTGVILDEDGSVLTNNHVVAGAEAIQVTTSDGLSYPASVVGTDPSTDLAVIRLDSPPEGLVPATFADSSTVEVGQPVMALGTPLGLENTVTTGIISAVDRPVTASGEGDGSNATYTSALQTDAAINPGNSGGPLVDAAGQVIGINTAIAGIPNASGRAGSIGLGFAIPSSTATMIAEQLREDGTADHAFVGVTSTDGSATADGATYGGAEVVSIEPGSPAAESSLREGDLIIGVGDTRVGSAAALTGVVRGLEIGSTHEFEVVRDGTVATVEITLGVRPS